MAKQQPIQALVRGLKLLAVLNEHPLATVSQLVAVSGFPKASVVRMLNTLRAEGYVELDDRGSGYKVAPKARLLSSSQAIRNPAISAIRRLLTDFSHAVKWPAEFLAPEGGAMVIQVSTRDVSPITLQRFEQTRFPIHDSAAGFVYLGAADEKEREARLRAVTDWQRRDATAIRTHAEKGIAEWRKTGFAQRDYDSPIEGTRIAAVPVMAGKKPVGALVLIYLRDAVWPGQLDDALLPQLREAAQRTGEIWSAYQG
jgi:IclR family mhp operon transcriptional activator